MLAVTIASLAILTVLMRRIGKTILFPPALFAATWLVTLSGVMISGRTFLPVGEYTCLIFLLGSLWFSAGSLLALYAVKPLPGISVRSDQSKRITRGALDLLLLTLIVLFPYYLILALKIAGTSSGMYLLVALHEKLVEADNANASSPFGIAGNLNVLASLVAVALIFEADRSVTRRVRAGLATLIAFSYTALTGSKGGVLLVLTLFFVSQVRMGGIRTRAALGGGALMVALFIGGLLAVNLAGRSFDSARAGAQQVGRLTATYWLGAPVAFAQIAKRPDALASSENIGRFFLQTGRSLGMSIDIPGLNARFTRIRPDGSRTNTYTIYFSYFKDYGWLGMIPLLAGVGASLTLLWRLAMIGRPVAILMYSLMCTAIFRSIYAESFFLGLNGYIKAYLCYCALYYLLPFIGAIRAEHLDSDSQPSLGAID